MCIISLLQYFIVLTDMENDQKRDLCDIHSLPEIVLDFTHSYTFPHTIHLAKIFLKLYSYPKFTDECSHHFISMLPCTPPHRRK